MTDDALEEIELTTIQNTLKEYGFQSKKNPDILSALTKFIHTTLFSYKRERTIRLSPYYIEEICMDSLTSPRRKHLQQLNKRFVFTYYLNAQFNEETDDVEYVLRVEKMSLLKPHFLKLLQELESLIVEDLYKVRLRCRIVFRKLWEEEKKLRLKEKETANDN